MLGKQHPNPSSSLPVNERALHLEKILEDAGDYQNTNHKRAYQRLLILRYCNEFVLIFLVQLIGLKMSYQTPPPNYPAYLGMCVLFMFWRGPHILIAVFVASLCYHSLQSQSIWLGLLWSNQHLMTCILILAISKPLIGTIIPLKKHSQWLCFLISLLLSCFLGEYMRVSFQDNGLFSLLDGLILCNGTLLVCTPFIIWGAYPLYQSPLQASRTLVAYITLMLLSIIGHQLWLTTPGYGSICLIVECISLCLIASKGRYAMSAAFLVLFLLNNLLASLISTNATDWTLTINQCIQLFAIALSMTLAIAYETPTNSKRLVLTRSQAVNGQHQHDGNDIAKPKA